MTITIDSRGVYTLRLTAAEAAALQHAITIARPSGTAATPDGRAVVVVVEVAR